MGPHLMDQAITWRSRSRPKERRPHRLHAEGMPGLHLHDLRHTGNMLAAESGAGLKDLMARMGHDNVRAAMIYQHAARGADKAITDAINKQLQARDVADEMPAG
ncbi:hypothetical protein Pth03_58850 [Planotetraspora thailandica]|uniref:Tyr recombinase domain-containing protein n=1 Tax=Planotetraspora thailandica TaxID=487172 RepID=A0A8J3V9M7_9ACTN|nr:hypothetical protein Pth03_58850 [Planotetraspora thailandica]